MFDEESYWYKLIGNAVCPPLIALLCGQILCSLEHKNQCKYAGVFGCIDLIRRASPVSCFSQLLERKIELPYHSEIKLSELQKLTQLQARSNQSSQENKKKNFFSLILALGVSVGILVVGKLYYQKSLLRNTK